MAYTDIDDPSTVFQTAIYTGTGSSNARTFGGNSDLSPDMLWFKNTGSTLNWMLWDTTRGITKYFYSNLNEGEGTTSSVLTAIGSDGFTVGNNNNVNESFLVSSYGWKKATGVFDIVSYTGNGSARTISHSLSAVPGWIIVKNRDGVKPLYIYHHKNTSAPATDYLALNTNGATTDSNTRWNDTAPTSSVFTVGTSDVVNKNTVKYIAYLFAEKQGYSKFGSYAANESVDGTFVYTGFKPAWVLLKQESTPAQSMGICGIIKRSTFNAVGRYLSPNVSGAEDSGEDVFRFTFQWFQTKKITGNRFNDADGTYILHGFC